MERQHPLFVKYKRDWLHQETGYSKGYLSRVATGRVPLTTAFVDRMSFKLGVPVDELFILETIGLAAGGNLRQN